MDNTIEMADTLVEIAQGEIQKADAVPKGLEMTEWVFSNQPNPALIQLFHSMYEGVFKNKIGIAHCRHKESGELVTLLVGVHTDGKNVGMFPLARILGEAEVNDFEAPDGKGGYVGGEE